ncbi:MAG: CIC family chloride channel protein [Planctomycetota bacterium]|jgi:CIC family chloride channel protein
MSSAPGSKSAVWKGAGTMAVLALVVGFVAGAGAVAFEYMSQGAFHVVMKTICGYAPSGPSGESELFHLASRPEILAVGIIFAPAIGGLLSGYLCFRFAPEAKGHGTDAAIDAYHNKGGFIRARVPLLKSITTAITLGTGGSGGREGPIAQIGAGFGSFLATKLRLDERQRRILLAAGMGAGVGSIFRAPLAGALFASEIMYREAEFESDVLLPSFLSSAMAYCVLCGWFGSFSHLFAIPSGLAFNNLADLGPYTVLAIILVPMIWLNIKVFYGVETLFDRMKGPKALGPALGGLLTGIVAVVLWKSTGDDRTLAVLSFGYGLLQEALDGALLGWTGVQILVLVAFFKILTTALTISSGGSGGVFGPAMVVGGAIGGAVGLTFQQMGLIEQPASFVVVGMCGFFAGSARTPISTIIMVSEMTGSYELLMPAMWVCAITFVACTPWTLYRKQVPNRAHSPAHKGEFMVPLLQDILVQDVMEDRAFQNVHLGTPLRDVVRLVADTHADYFPVLDSDERFVGIFSAHDIRSFTYDDTIHQLAVAADLMTTSIISVNPNDDLHVAMQRFNLKNIDELPVVDPENKHILLGMLRRRAMSRAYGERLKIIQEAKKNR